MINTFRSIFSAAVFLALAVISCFVYCLSQGAPVQKISEPIVQFDIAAPPPPCDKWRAHMPRNRDPKAFQLYSRARKLWRSKIGWQLTLAETTQILADVRKAAELGDWGARALLAHFYLNGLGALDSNHVLDAAPQKAIEIARSAAQNGQPWGFYDLGVGYEQGYGGLQYDPKLAWAHYLHAAKLGSPEAQMALATAYGEVRRLDDRREMLLCAYRQGHGAAAHLLGVEQKASRKDFRTALNYFQEGVKFGSRDCAAVLFLLFDGETNTDATRNYLMAIGIGADPERSRRYKILADALTINPDLKLTRLDSVVPLPPAELPPWRSIEDAIEAESNDPPSY